MRIGIDIDDTISDTYEVSFAYAQMYTINELKRDAKIQNSSISHHFYLKDMHHWDNDEEMNFWHEHYGEIIKQVNPFTFAVDTIKKLKEEGNEIIIITARWPEENADISGITLEWLKRNHIEYDDIILNVNDKAKVALDKKIDLFIDDSFQNCVDVANAGIKTYMMESRTNKGLNHEKVSRVYSWPDIYNRIKKEENI